MGDSFRHRSSPCISSSRISCCASSVLIPRNLAVQGLSGRESVRDVRLRGREIRPHFCRFRPETGSSLGILPLATVAGSILLAIRGDLLESMAMHPPSDARPMHRSTEAGRC